jgi:hypothetical protein
MRHASGKVVAVDLSVWLMQVELVMRAAQSGGCTVACERCFSSVLNCAERCAAGDKPDSDRWPLF